MIMANITPFMTWWVNLVVNTLTKLFNILDSFEFMETTLLEVTISIVIISAMIPILLTLANTTRISVEKAERRKAINDRQNNKKSK